MSLAEAETTDLSDEQIDSLVERAESPPSQGKEIPMTAAEAGQPPTPAEEFEITHGGKQIKATRDQLIKWAQQGYDYPQKAQKLNQERMRMDQAAQQQKEWEKQWSPYKQIDEWAAKNPEQWQRLQQNWQQAQQGQPAQVTNQPGANDPYAPVIQNLRSELSELKTVAQSWQEHQTAQVAKQEDEKLDQEIQSIREKYKDLDWATPDENGKSLEFKVLEHAQTNGIKNFNTAFKDFYHDELIARAQAQAQQNVSKDIQAKSKMGILGKTPTPVKGIPAVKDVKKQSYEDIMSEIREERRQGLY